MKHVVRRVISSDRSKTIGHGVFMAWNVANILENTTISIEHCTDPDDARPLREQAGKAYKMRGLYPTEVAAKASADRLSEFKIKTHD